MPRRFSRALPTLTNLVGSLNDRLLFAVPKKGRLNQACIELLSGSDIQFHRHNRLDIALVKNLPLALVFLPASDIPTFVGEGRVDLGITGRDVVAEHEAVTPPTETSGIQELMDLEIGRCKLQVQVPEKGDLHTPEWLVGKTLVTSFTGLSEQYFREMEKKVTGAETNGEEKLKTTIKYVGGSVEAACALGVADGIVDLVGKMRLRRTSILAVDTNNASRIRRDHARRRPQSNRNRRRVHRRPHLQQTAFRPEARQPDHQPHQGYDHRAEVRALHLQRRAQEPRQRL